MKLSDIPDVLEVLYTGNMPISVVYYDDYKKKKGHHVYNYLDALKIESLTNRDVKTIDVCESADCVNIWLW